MPSADIIPRLRRADRECVVPPYHIHDQPATATEYFLLSEFQRRYDAWRGLRPDLVWSATGGSDPRFTCRLSLLLRNIEFSEKWLISREKMSILNNVLGEAGVERSTLAFSVKI